jgi:hypothetical protein
VKRIAAAVATDSNGDAVSLRSAWAQWQTDGRAFWQQMDALVETLDGLITEDIERVCNVADGVTFTSVFKQELLRRVLRRHLCAGDQGLKGLAAGVAAVHLPDRRLLRSRGGHIGRLPEPTHKLDELGGLRVRSNAFGRAA